MKELDLRNLISHLSNELRKALEVAAALCVEKKDTEITIEHWLIALLQNSGEDMACIISSQQLSTNLILNELQLRLKQHNQFNDTTPTLSQSLISLIKDAWLITSVNQDQATINAFHIMLAFLDNEEKSLIETPLTIELNKISKEKLLNFSNEKLHPKKTLKDSESSNPALEKYCIDMTLASIDNQPNIIGRDEEIRQVIDILSRRLQNNPILVGDAGVGKTAIVEGLAQSIILGEVPDSMKDTHIHRLDLGLLQAGASVRGEFESRLKDILNEVKQTQYPIIIFIDEAHTLIGAGGMAGQNDAANLLKPALARGEISIIAATTWTEYKRFFEKDAALTRRFQPVTIKEPDEHLAIDMLRSLAQILESHHQVSILDAAITAAVQLSIRHLPDRQLPDKAVTLLDSACSRVALSRQAPPPSLQRLIQKQQSVEKQLEWLKKDQILGSGRHTDINNLTSSLKNIVAEKESLNHTWKCEQQAVQKISELHNTLKENISSTTEKFHQQEKLIAQRKKLNEQQKENPLAYDCVDANSVANVVSDWTGIPSGQLLAKEIQQLVNLETILLERVIGQDCAITDICHSIRIGRTGLSDTRKPIGVFLLCGPSGVGKTETALALADVLYGGERNMTVINMTEFKEAHKVSMLLGAPAGYVGFGEGGVLTEAVRRTPYSILLLDEFEKAHASVHDIFYQIFDKGYINDSEGREIDFHQTIIIMTSNAADTLICDISNKMHDNGKSALSRDPFFPAINNELLHYFKPAFLGRVTVVPYLPLDRDSREKICRLALKRTENNLLKKYGATLMIENDVVNYLSKERYCPETGARSIEKAINKHLLPQLSLTCLSYIAQGKEIQSVKLFIQENKLAFSINKEH